MKKTVAVALLALLAATGCSQAVTPAAPNPVTPAAAAPSTSGDVLASLGLAGLNGRQIVERLDQDPAARPLAMKASVRSDRVVVGDGRSEVSVPIGGDDAFYLSVAPYLTRTHDCYFHSLATCKGELAGRTVHVTITDSAGKRLVDADATTYANGFVGFWLPRGIKGTVTVSADGRTGTVPFATGAEDATCLTSLKLA